MTEEEYESIKSDRIIPTINILNLENRRPRTLLYGYDVDKNTVHLYFRGWFFVYLRYNAEFELLESKENDVLLIDSGIGGNTGSFVPNKRVYWDRSDYEFCKLLKDRNVHVAYTGSNGPVELQQYYGRTFEEFKNIKRGR